MPEQADRVQAEVDHDLVASLERALAEARAQYGRLRRTLDEVVAHRDRLGAERT